MNKKYVVLAVISVILISLSTVFLYLSVRNNSESEVDQGTSEESAKTIMSHLYRPSYTMNFEYDWMVQTNDAISTDTSKEADFFVNNHNYASEDELSPAVISSGIEIIHVIEYSALESEFIDNAEITSLDQLVKTYYPDAKLTTEKEIALDNPYFISYRQSPDSDKAIFATISGENYVLFINIGIKSPSTFQEIITDTDFSDDFGQTPISTKEALINANENIYVSSKLALNPNLKLAADHTDLANNRYVLQLYEDVKNGDEDPGHTATTNWIYVDMITGEISKEFDY